MRLIQVTISESASVDTQTNQLSIFNIIENVNIIGTLPIQYPRMVLVAVWQRNDPLSSSSEERLTARVSIKSSQPTNSLGDEFDVMVLPGQARVRAMINLVGIPINASGFNQIIIEVRNGQSWEQAGEVSFIVVSAEG